MVKIIYEGVTYKLPFQEKDAIDHVVEKVKKDFPAVDVGVVIGYIICTGADYWDAVPLETARSRDFVLLMTALKKELEEKK